MKGKDGFALVMVIILIAFLAIVSIGLVALWQGAVNQLVQQEESMQAYYLARSGAAALASWIISHPATATSIVNIKSNQIHLKSGSVGTVQVSLIQSGSNLTVVSTGIVNGAKETLKLTLVKAQSGFNFTKAIITKSLTLNSGSTVNGSVEIQAADSNTIINSNAKINGNLQINGSLTLNSNSNINGNLQVNGSNLVINSNVDIGGTIELNKNASFTENGNSKYNIVPGNPPLFPLTFLPLPAMPSGLPQRSDIIINNSTITINASGSYNNITVNSNSTLNFDTSSGSITVYVNNITFNSNCSINIIGKNRLTLFVGNYLTFNSNVSFNNSNAQQLLILSATNSNITINANNDFNGYIYAPNSTVTFNSNSGIIHGGVVSNNFTMNSNCNLNPAFIPIQFANNGNVCTNFTIGTWSY